MIYRPARKRQRLFSVFMAQHVEGEHHAAGTRMSRVTPRIAVKFDKRQHFRPEQGNRHDAVTLSSRKDQALLSRAGCNPERRPRPLRGTRKRSGRRETMESSVVT